MAFRKIDLQLVDTDVTNLEDPLLVYNHGITGNNTRDIGIIAERGNLDNVGIIWDESTDQFALIVTSEDGSTNGDVSISSYANLRANTITASLTGDVTGDVTGDLTGNVTGNVTGDLTGDVTGNADSATTLTGLTSSVTELNYSDGVTSSIQTQLDGKLSTTGGTITSNLAITGNLTVNGTTTTVNSTVVDIADPIITLGSNASDDNKDRGIAFKWNTGGDTKVGFFGYDDSDGKFVFIKDGAVTSEVSSGTLGDIKVAGVTLGGDLELNSNNITGTGYIELTAGNTYDPPGTGTDTSDNVGLALADGGRVVFTSNGFIRNVLSATPNGSIDIGQSGTGYITGINLYPGSAGSVNLRYGSDVILRTLSTGVDITGDLALTDTTAGSAAGPEYELYRNITGADANYIGQIKFSADNDADQKTVFAKITGKIGDASDGTEDGIIEVTHKKGGSNNISGRWNSSNLQLLNGTGLEVAGDVTISGVTTVGGKILPDTTETYDIGSTTARFNDIYLAGSTVDIGGTKISKDSDGNIDLLDANDNRKIIKASAIELFDSSGKKIKIERDATSGKMKSRKFDSSGVAESDSDDVLDISEDKSPQLGGKLDVNGNNIVFADSATTTDDRLVFGDHNDMSIYHNGSHNRIDSDANLFFNVLDTSGVIISGDEQYETKDFVIAGSRTGTGGAISRLKFRNRGGSATLTASTAETNIEAWRVNSATPSLVFDFNGTAYHRFDDDGKVALGAVPADFGTIDYTVDITGTLGVSGNTTLSGTLNTHTIPSGTGTLALTSDLSGYLTSVALNDISDVTLSSVSSGQVLKYNGSAWVNSADSGGIALTDISVSTASAGTAALAYNNSTGAFTFTPPDLSSYITDYTVTESDVTTHQAALSITESQISDLGSYITKDSGDTLSNKGGNISQWTNDSGYMTASSTNTLTNKSGNISQWTNDSGYITGYTVTESDVTGHQAALSITESQISDLGSYLTSETTTTLTGDSVNQRLQYVDEAGTTNNIDLSWAVDDTNLARITSGSVASDTGIATFTRDDASTFTVDFSALFDDTNLARITAASWNTSNGVLTLTRGGDSTTVTVDLDGRYLTAESDTLATVLGRGAASTTTAIIRFYYDNQAAFPNATTYHGAIAHSHSDGAMYFAHSGAWQRLANYSELPTGTIFTASGQSDSLQTHDGTQVLFDLDDIAAGSAVKSHTSGNTPTISGGTVTADPSGFFLNGTYEDIVVRTNGAGTGTAGFANPTGAASIFGFRGTSGTTTSRHVASASMNTTNAVSLKFYLIAGNSSNGGENTDSGDDFKVYYSTNSGSSWTLMATYLGNSATYKSWQDISITLPSAAKTSGTMFKFENLHTAGTYDHWAISLAHIVDSNGDLIGAGTSGVDSSFVVNIDGSDVINATSSATTFTGSLTGNVTGNVTGNIDGIVGGNTPAAGSFTTVNASSTITGNVTGNLTGNVTGNTSGSAATFTSTTQNSQFNSIGVGTAASTSAGDIRATADVTAYYSSDARLKENVVEIDNALDKVKSIRGVTYDWKDEHIESKGGADDYFMRKHDVGVIAQEIESVLPEIVAERDDGIKAVRYERLTALLIEAVKELSAKVDAQQEEINILKGK